MRQTVDFFREIYDLRKFLPSKETIGTRTNPRIEEQPLARSEGEKITERGSSREFDRLGYSLTVLL